MDISRPDSKSTPGLDPSAGLVPPGQGVASARPASQTATSDQAQLSGLGAYLTSALNGSPALVSKLSELSTAVSNGQYHVDAYAVSGSIIQHGIEFGGATYLAVTS
jgi:anti-sigma28 factor (negative regulator of flagellin synthesis)